MDYDGRSQNWSRLVCAFSVAHQAIVPAISLSPKQAIPSLRFRDPAAPRPTTPNPTSRSPPLQKAHLTPPFLPYLTCSEMLPPPAIPIRHTHPSRPYPTNGKKISLTDIPLSRQLAVLPRQLRKDPRRLHFVGVLIAQRAKGEDCVAFGGGEGVEGADGRGRKGQGRGWRVRWYGVGWCRVRDLCGCETRSCEIGGRGIRIHGADLDGEKWAAAVVAGAKRGRWMRVELMWCRWEARRWWCAWTGAAGVGCLA